MEDLTTAILYHKPEDVNAFILAQLQLKHSQGFKTGLMTHEEITNIFRLFDLTNREAIDQSSCRQALRIIASSELQTERVESAQIGERVSLEEFRGLVSSLLGM